MKVDEQSDSTKFSTFKICLITLRRKIINANARSKLIPCITDIAKFSAPE